jgi:hypothetical protein
MADTPRILNMRPDPPDLRDRLYNPILRALEPEFNVRPFDQSAWHARVKEQGATAACTGFARAAMVETLTFKCWEAQRRQGEPSGKVKAWDFISAPTATDAALTARCRATSHTAFDTDPDTMRAILERIKRQAKGRANQV